MRSALLKVFSGDPETDTLSDQLEGGLPAATAEATHYLDDHIINHGTVAGEVVDETPMPVVGSDGIHTEPEQVSRKTSAEYHADLTGGWAGATSSDGTRLLTSFLASESGVILEDAEINLEAFVETLPETADVNGMVYSGETASGSAWHQGASRSRLPTEGISAIAVSYSWDGMFFDGLLAASGYVAVYSSWQSATFARWVADEVQPHLDVATDDQEELGGGA